MTDEIEECPIPNGELALRTLAMPGDTNPNGDIFGGWIMSQMDIAGGILSKEAANHPRMVTVGVEAMRFHKPVKIGDVVCCYGAVKRVGNTSITIHLEVWVKPVLRQEEFRCPRFLVTEADFTYVAIDESGNKTRIEKEEPSKMAS